MDMVDDASGITLSMMSEEETTEVAMKILWAWINTYGIPWALYVDWKNVYLTKREPTLDEQLSGNLPLTQFGKACKKLGIKIMPASSPQAKGRVERKNGVYQDRLVKEFRLQGIRDIEGANKFLPKFSDILNVKFAVEPRSTVDYHRPVPKGMDLRSVFCFEEERTVSNDWVVRYDSRFFQILPQSNLPPSKKKVTVQKYLDGSIHIIYRGREVIFSEIKELPRKQTKVISEEPKNVKQQKQYIPPKDHPWRHFNLQSASNKSDSAD